MYDRYEGYEMKARALMGLNQDDEAYQVLDQAVEIVKFGKGKIQTLKEKLEVKQQELDKFEKSKKIKLPEFFKRWVIANPHKKRTPEYFFESMKVIKEVLKFMTNPILF